MRLYIREALYLLGDAHGRVAGSSLTPREASAAMALMTAATEANTHIAGFTGGMVQLPLSPSMRLDDAVRAVSGLPFDRTDCAQPMLYALERRLKVDAFVVYTDIETSAGSIHPVQALRQYREQTGIAAKLVVVGMVSNGFSIADPNDAGSRAWGFPSRDSDYDVRFIYVRPVEDYLSVFPRRDVIERPADAVLDVNGWDIRKALQLMLRSNAVLQEWLSSPVRYIDRQPARQQLLELVQASADLRAFEYHYDHQARRSLAEITSSGESVRLKSYCYALRAALALHWLRERRTPPPMDVRSLMSGLDLPPHLDTEIFRLIESKLSATEQSIAMRNLNLDGFIERILAQPVGQANALDRPDIVARADALLASIVQGNMANAHSNTSSVA